MRKIIITALILLLSVGLFACNNSKDAEKKIDTAGESTVNEDTVVSKAAYWQTKNIWNDGFGSLQHYMNYGKSFTTGEKIDKADAQTILDTLKKELKNKTKYNDQIVKLSDDKYKEFKTNWAKSYEEMLKLEEFINKNGIPKKGSNYDTLCKKFYEYHQKVSAAQ